MTACATSSDSRGPQGAVCPVLGGYLPVQARRVRHSRVIPPVVMQVGKLVGLIYRSERAGHSGSRTYIHLMYHPPSLVCDLAGRQLYIVGGAYRVTPQGIVGAKMPAGQAEGVGQ